MVLPAALDPTSLTLVDLVVLLVVVLAVTGVVRRRGGLVAAAAVLVSTAVGLWLAVSALAVWAPQPVDAMARDSGLLRAVPAPSHALHQAGRLVDELASSAR